MSRRWVAVAGQLRVECLSECDRRCWLRGWLVERGLLAGVAGCRLAWWGLIRGDR